jgi:hypothetical protein
MGPVPKVCANKLPPWGAIRKSPAPKFSGDHWFEFGYTSISILMDEALSLRLIVSA